MIKVRFAAQPDWPSDTRERAHRIGQLFVRTAVTAGSFLLRIDDVDREHYKSGYAEAIAADLRWLGVDWDETIHQSRSACIVC